MRRMEASPSSRSGQGEDSTGGSSLTASSPLQRLVLATASSPTRPSRAILDLAVNFFLRVRSAAARAAACSWTL